MDEYSGTSNGSERKKGVEVVARPVTAQLLPLFPVFQVLFLVTKKHLFDLEMKNTIDFSFYFCISRNHIV